MSEDIKKKEDCNAEEYTVQELFDRLMADDSWEANPALRGAAIGMLRQKLPSA